jgi:CRP-like cAMP-binding protein
VKNVLIRKLKRFGPLDERDEILLTEVVSDSRSIAAREDIIHEGERPEKGHLIVSGFGCRYKVLPNGTRQVVGCLIPGDFIHLQRSLLNEMDHSIGTLSPCIVVDIPRDLVLRLHESTAIAHAFRMVALVDESITREWLASMGRRDALARLGHLLCELFTRYQAVDLVDRGSFEFPMRQTEIAETLGLSNVHVNRVLQELRGLQLIQLKLGKATILDLAQLKVLSGFNPNYLHLGPETQRWDPELAPATRSR